MRIVHVIPSLEGGGAERQLAYLAGAQAARGDDVHVVPIRGGGSNEALLDARCTLHPLGLRRPSSPRAGPRTLGLVRRLAPDVVHTWMLHGNVWGGAAARVLGIPWVLAERSSPRDFGPRAPLLTAIHLVCGQLADAIVANSPAGLEFWKARARRRVVKYLIPNGLPLDVIDAVAPAPAASLPGGGARPIVVWAGRMDGNKNVLSVVDAFARVLHETEACLLLCGDGPDRAAAEARIDAGARDRIVFSGYRSDLWSLMKAASALVSYSSYEGNPNVVQEAMACRLPLVVSDIEGHRQALDEESASFVRPGDAAGLAAAITEVLRHTPAARERAGRARRIAEGLSMNVVAERTQRVYDELLGKRAAKPSEN